MAWFGLFNRDNKDKKPSSSYTFSDDDRIEAVEIRRIGQEIRKTQRLIELERHRAELKILRDELNSYEDEEDISNENPDTMLMSLLSQILNKGQNAPTNAQNTPVATSFVGEVSLSDNLIKEEIAKIPQATLKQLQSLSKEEVTAIINKYYPSLNPQTRERAVEIIQTVKI